MNDKSCNSSLDSTTTSSSNTNTRDQYLRHLNKISHKISKPIRKPPFDSEEQQLQNMQQQQQPHQPPVYNIKKSDFRDVVQKLTGSPAHENFSTSTSSPIHQPKPPSSRLQRIRPPPLAQVGNRPSLLLNNAVLPQPSTTATHSTNDFIFNNNNNLRPPFSPLPPFPSVHAAAESPISAYMRYLQLQSSISTGDLDSKRISGLSPLAPLVSPRWNNPNSSQQQQQQQQVFPPSPTSAMAPSQFLMPSSPLAFGGRLPSPQSPYGLLSPSLLFSSPTGQLGFPQFPLSPRLPVPSPRWPNL